MRALLLNLWKGLKKYGISLDTRSPQKITSYFCEPLLLHVLPVNFLIMSLFTKVCYIFFFPRTSHVEARTQNHLIFFKITWRFYIWIYYIIFSHYIAKFPSLVTTWLGKIRYLPSKELQVSFPHIGAFQSFSDFLFKTETVIKTSRAGGSQSHSRSWTAVRLCHFINWNMNYN